MAIQKVYLLLENLDQLEYIVLILSLCSYLWQWFVPGNCSLEIVLIFGSRNTSFCNLLNLLLFFPFPSVKLVFWHISCHAWSEICSKLTLKVQKKVKLTIKLKINTSLTSFWFLYYQIWIHPTSCYSVSFVDFDQLIVGWGCCLLFWRFGPAGINLGKVSTYGDSRMRENTYGRVTFLINLMFSRRDSFDGSIFEGTYIWDVNCVTHLGDVYSRGFYTGRGVGAC